MYTATIGEGFQWEIDLASISWDIQIVKENKFHILKDGKSYEAHLLEANFQEKSFSIRIQNQIYHVSLKDRFDHLVEQLGFAEMLDTTTNDILAPMPGLVLDILVVEGQTVEQGDAIVILEAMKMENVIKVSGNSIIKKIHAKKGQAVEKNEILVELT